MIRYILPLLFLPSLSVLAQPPAHHSVSGTVRDKSTGEVLIGANVALAGVPGGITTNSYGFYSLTAPPGRYTLVASYSDYAVDSVQVDLQRDQSVNIGLSPAARELQEVIVTSPGQKTLTQPLMGVDKLTTKEIQYVPVIFGEKDILKTIQLLPGVTSGGDGNSNFFVRGGASDQNLILLDEAPVYNATHLLGFFSVFNSDAIKDVTLYKGGMPAEYGGRLSSVLDVRMNDGNDEKYVVSGGIGLISSRINVEGPIVKDKGSFIVSARRTYADLFLKLSKDTNLNDDVLYFYDLNAKADYHFGDHNAVYLSGYTGLDDLGYKTTFGVTWGNSTGTLRWNHIYNSRLFSNTSLIFSKYNYNAQLDPGTVDQVGLTTSIRDVNLKEDFQYYIGSKSQLNFGANVIHHEFSPGTVDANSGSNYNPVGVPNKSAYESAAYVSHSWHPNKRFRFEYGLRVSDFVVLGPGTFYSYNQAGEVVDSSNYGSGAVVRNYLEWEPRFSVSFQLDSLSTIKAAFDRNAQNVHLITNENSLNPLDIWLPSSNNIQPELANQYSVGYFRDFAGGRYSFSAETYYKTLENQIDYRNGATLQANAQIESQLLYGKGKAYGLELYLKKKTGRLSGWVSTTLSRTWLQIDGINDGNWYPASQDRPLNVSVVGIYQLSKHWTLGGDLVYMSGSAVTFPAQKYVVDGQTTFYYPSRNASRTPSYNRMDLSATFEGKKTAHYEWSWSFGLYNAYGRENPYIINFQQNPNDPSQTQAVQVALFRWVPSVTFNFKFE